MKDPCRTPIHTGAGEWRPPVNSSVQVQSDRKDIIYWTMYDGVLFASKVSARIGWIKLLKPSLMSKKSEETFRPAA